MHRRVAKPAPWRVFLSHTSELRQHPGPGNSYVDRAERAVSAAGHVIADMADFASADQKPASLCAETVGECDVYVGIFGLRYGSPVRDRPEVSYTELEFETATEKGLPRLVFLVDSDSGDLGLPPRALVDLEYGQRQAVFLQRVRDGGLTVQRFRNPDHLALLVERSLRALEKRSASASPQPAQPSRGPAGWSWPTAWEFRAYREEKRRDFVGRAWLFAEVRAWATDPSPKATQALLIGADYGVGKSAFLAELIDNAHQSKGQDSHGPGIPIAAQHFCTTEQDATLTAGLFVRSVAAQLAGALPAYRQALEADGASERRHWLDEAAQDPERAFDQSVLALLQAIDPPPPPQLLVVDALDEAQDPRSSGGPATQQTIVHLLARYANRLPPWLKLLATSRRRPDVLTPLRQGFSLKELNAEEARNLADLRAYAEARCLASPLAERLQKAHLSASEVAEFLSGKEQSGGKFLYVVRVLKDLESGLLPLSGRADLEALPPGMDGFYREAFERRFPSEESYGPARELLGVLCEQREPLGRRELAALLGCTERQIAASLRPLHDLLRLQTVTAEREGATAKEVVHSFDHLSLPQWLSEEDEWVGPRSGRFAVDRPAAAERLRAWALAEVEAERVHRWPYLVRHLASHLTAAERPGLIAGLLGQFAWLEARLRLAGINGLLGDFALAAPSPWLGRLERALRQGAHVLGHSEGWRGHEQLASQLLARLADSGEETERLKGQAFAWLHQAGGAPPLIDNLVAHEALLSTLPVGREVTTLAMLPDGRLAFDSEDNTIRLWDPSTGSCSRTLKGHQDLVKALAVLSDGRLISGSDDATIRLWDPATGACEQVFQGHQGWVMALAALPDGRLASASDDCTIRLWNPTTGSCSDTLWGHQGTVSALAVLSDGRLASGASDHTIRVWDPATGSCTAVFEGHQGWVMALAALPDGRLASASDDCTIRLWDPDTGSCSTVIEGDQGWVRALAALPDGRLASASDDCTIRLWDPATGSCTAVFEGHQGWVNTLAVLPNGHLASGSEDTTIRLWDPTTGASTAVFEGHQGWVMALAVLGDGRLASSSFDDTMIWLRETGSGVCTGVLLGHRSVVTAMATLPDGRLASGSYDRTLRLWNPATADCTAVLQGHRDRVTALAVLHEGSLASASEDWTIRLWNPATGACTGTFEAHQGSVTSLAVLRDGGLASASIDGTIRLWNTTTGSCTAAFKGHQWDVTALAVLGDGRLASGSSDNTIRLWDPATGSCTAVFEGHQGWVRALAALPDGRLASGSSDNTIRLWDPARPDGAPRVLFVADAPITALVAHPTLPLLVAGDGSGRLHWLELPGGG